MLQRTNSTKCYHNYYNVWLLVAILSKINIKTLTFFKCLKLKFYTFICTFRKICNLAIITVSEFSVCDVIFESLVLFTTVLVLYVNQARPHGSIGDFDSFSCDA